MPFRTTFLLILLALSSMRGTTVFAQVAEQDSLALVALYNATDGPNWANNTNWLTGPVSTWFGVFVSESRVFSLALDRNQLSGSIPPQLGNLTNLESLLLNINNLSGPIPSEMGNLTALEALILGENGLSGPIPAELGQLSNLQFCELQINSLSGTIPTELGQLSNLESLWLYNNQLTGVIPSELSQLDQLQSLILNTNQLSGLIPAELGQLVNLEFFRLDSNLLSGTIPSELGQLNNLQTLSLSSNQLSGEIPAEIGNLSSLQSLGLNQNQFSGEIPPEIGNLSSLQSLGLYFNELSGSIPAELGNMNGLEILQLQNNELSGEIPTALGNLSNLRSLVLSNNQLSGAIPLSLTSLTLTTFLFNNTNLCEPADEAFQTWLDQVPNVQSSGMSCSGGSGSAVQDSLALVALYNATDGPNWTNNDGWLTGPVDSWFGVTVTGDRVSRIILNSNQLSGAIPPELGNLSDLQALILFENQLSGAIPIQLGNLSNLQALNLILNNLDGSIPSQLGQLINLTSLALGQNQLSGQIPQELGQLTNLTYLSLEGNPFSGPLPLSLINLPLDTFIFGGTDLCEPTDVAFQTWLDGIANLVNTGISCTPEGGGVAEQDSLALVALYNATDGPNWTNNTNWLSGPVASWFGITVLEDQVTEIILQVNRLSGSIPSDLANLTALQQLNLGSPANNNVNNPNNNVLSGPIPPELGNLSQLRELDLGWNSLSGSIPPELGNLINLQRLDLFDNQLSGPIPVELSNLSNLEVLFLSNNQLNGAIPTELANLANLEILRLSNNQLTGTIPTELASLSKLETLRVFSNQLTGTIPTELANLTNLRVLELDNNQLTGTIPTELANLANLNQLRLSLNQLTGSIPPDLAELSNLEILLLNNNQLTGSIPTTFGALTNLFWLNLSDNQLMGTIPTELANLTNLSVLSLSNNPLAGPLPLSITNLSLDNFSYSGTQLCEPPDTAFQTWLGGIRILTGTGVTCSLDGSGILADSLALIALYNATDGENWINRRGWLTSSVAAWEGIIVQGGRVTDILMSENNLSGSLPPELGQMDQLQVLGLNQNQLTGPIPPELGQLSNLEILFLRNNFLSGPIPTELGNLANLRRLSLRQNRLSGSIPNELGQLTNLELLYLNDNQLSGFIPSELGQLTRLFELRLGTNQLTGAVPPELGQLAVLADFQLDNNRLTDLPDLSALGNLASLSVENNRFTLADIEPNWGVASNTFTYAPQAMVGENGSLGVSVGDTLMLSFNIGGQNTTYRWFRDGQTIEDATGDTLIIPNVQLFDEGSYRLTATNPLIPDLTLESARINVNIIPLIAGLIIDEEPTEDTALPVTGSASGFTPTQGTLFYRRTGEPSYQRLDFTPTVEGLQGTIPADYLTPRGIEYYVEVSDGQRTVTRPATDPAENPEYLPVRLSERDADLTLAPDTYQMISIPLALDDSALSAVLEDDMGDYDPAEWRLFRWIPLQGQYEEYASLSDSFTPGTTFWINSRTGGSFDVGASLSTDASERYPVTLQPGWNQIGNPFAFPIAWSSAGSNERVETPVAHDGTEYQYNQNVLKPWNGYFVFNPEPGNVTVYFQPIEATEEASKTAGTLVADDSYVLQLKAEAPDYTLCDTQNYLGFSPTTNNLAEAPGIGSHLRLSIVEDNHRLAASFKPLNTEGQTWSLELDATLQQDLLPQRKHVEISLIEHGLRPEGFNVFVFDVDKQHPIRVEEGRFTLWLDPTEGVRHLRVVVGTDAYAEQQQRETLPQVLTTTLEANYPNPFSEQTRIRYVLGETGTVELAVYNVLGQRVRLLTHGEQEAGRHEVVWDGRDDTGGPVAPGLYFCRLKTAWQQTTRPLMLLR